MILLNRPQRQRLGFSYFLVGYMVRRDTDLYELLSALLMLV